MNHPVNLTNAKSNEYLKVQELEPAVSTQYVSHNIDSLMLNSKLTIALHFIAFAEYHSSSPLKALRQYTVAVSLALEYQLMYAGCYPSLLNSAYPLQSDTCDRHSRPLMPWYQLSCYH